MRVSSQALFAALIAVLLGISLFGYYEFTRGTMTTIITTPFPTTSATTSVVTSVEYVTGTSVDNAGDKSPSITPAQVLSSYG
jgi:hypothetical protein